jgi:hypothetical protein
MQTTTIEQQRKQHPDYCECTRCEIEPGVPFSWIKRVAGRPKRCPNCNSPAWDRERRLPKRTDRTGEAG